MKRILDCGPADFEKMDGAALLGSVRRSEGRTLLCEVLWSAAPLVDGVSNAEVVAAFGTSQEGSDPETVRQLALAAKRVGADVLHLGDMGAFALPEPTNVMAASLAIRGRRHTYRRMAMR